MAHAIITLVVGMDLHRELAPITQQVSRQYVHTEVSGSAQVQLGDHIGDVHHHYHARMLFISNNNQCVHSTKCLVAAHTETLPSPTSTVPFRRDIDYIDRGTLERIYSNFSTDFRTWQTSEKI